jgi:PilZ domain
MNFEQGILQELADVVMLDRWRSQRSNGEDHFHNVPHVGSLLLIRSEIVQSASLIAAVTCLANLLEADEASDLEGSALGHFVTQLSDTIGHALDDLRRDHYFFSVVQAWQCLNGQLRLAKALTHALLETALPGSRRARVDIEAVADAWRRAAHLCHQLHAKTAAKLIAEGVSVDSKSDSTIMDLLEDAAIGGVGCLDADGFISIPERAERRFSTRVAVSLPVNIFARNTSFPATVVNASTTGFGLRLDTPLRVGDNITVQISDGRELIGTVMWSLRDKAGFKLASLLGADDPIFNYNCREAPA